MQTTDALGNVTTSTYDASDNKLTETNALAKTTRFAYDVPDPMGPCRGTRTGAMVRGFLDRLPRRKNS